MPEEIEHETPRESRQLHIHHGESKIVWIIWIIIVFLIIAVGFGVAFFILWQNQQLTAELEGGFVQEPEKFSRKVIRGIGETVAELKEVAGEDEGIEWANFQQGHYDMQYPYGWHVHFSEESTPQERIRYTSLYRNPIITYSEARGSMDDISFVGRSLTEGKTIQDFITESEQRLANTKLETIKNANGLTVYKLMGERLQSDIDTGGPPPYQATIIYFLEYEEGGLIAEAYENRVIVAYVEPTSLSETTERDRANQEILDQIMQTFNIR